jgi:hypothetical protein
MKDKVMKEIIPCRISSGIYAMISQWNWQRIRHVNTATVWLGWHALDRYYCNFFPVTNKETVLVFLIQAWNWFRKENSIVTDLFWYFFILQPVSPSREFPGPVHVAKDWTEMTISATYGLLKNIGNKNFWKTTFRYCIISRVFVMWGILEVLTYISASRDLIIRFLGCLMTFSCRDDIVSSDIADHNNSLLGCDTMWFGRWASLFIRTCFLHHLSRRWWLLIPIICWHSSTKLTVSHLRRL